MNIRQAILNEVNLERVSQEHRWGNDTDDTKNTPWMYTAYIAQYAGSWMRGKFLPLAKSDTDLFRTAMLKVAALAVAAVESIDRQRAGERGRPFYEEADPTEWR
jgi:hypothetical protein